MSALNGIISIAINYPHLYSEMCKRRIDKDKFNIEAQAKITIGHEIGHGLVDYIKRMNLKLSGLKELPNLAIIRKCGEKKKRRNLGRGIRKKKNEKTDRKNNRRTEKRRGTTINDSK